MKFNANDILTSATIEFGGGVLGDESLDLVEDCIEIAHQWSLECADGHADGHADGKNRHQLRRELRKYVRQRVDFSRPTDASYIPSFIWQWLAQTIINWIVRRIIDSIIS